MLYPNTTYHTVAFQDGGLTEKYTENILIYRTSLLCTHIMSSDYRIIITYIAFLSFMNVVMHLVYVTVF